MRQISKEEYDATDDTNFRFDPMLLPTPPDGYRWSNGKEQRITQATHWHYLILPEGDPDYEHNDGRVIWVCANKHGKLYAGLVNGTTGVVLNKRDHNMFVTVLLTKARLGLEEMDE